MRKYFVFMICLSLASAVNGQLRKSVTWERVNGTGPELEQIGELATRHSKDIKSSPWSVGCETLDRDFADFSLYKDYVGELGVKHARLQSGWAKTEKEKGVYDFEWLDEIVYGLVDQGVNPWICLCYGNPIYNSKIDLGSRIFTDEETLTAWCNYVEATVDRYKDVVQEWEIWNEPRESAEAYTNLVIRSIASIKKVKPDATIIAFTAHGIYPENVARFPRKVCELLKEKNSLGQIDYMTYHPYNYNPDKTYDIIDSLVVLIDEYDPKMKLYMGEGGCPSALEWGHALNNHLWTEYSQAKWVLRRMAGDWARNIRSSIFTFVDLRYNNMLQSFGLIRANLLHELIYKRPAYYGVQNLTGFFDYEVKPAGLLSYTIKSDRSLTVASFDKENTPVVLLWYDDKVPTDDLNRDEIKLTINKLNFEDPVYVDMLTGKVYELASKSWKNKGEHVRFKKLPVWDSPIMLVERNKLDLK